MLTRLRNVLSSENDQDPSFVMLVRSILIIASIGSAVLSIVQAFAVKEPNDWATVFAIGIITIISGISLLLSYRNILWPGKLLFPILVLVAVTFIAINANGLHDSAIVGFPIVIIFASLLLGQKAIPMVAILTIIGVWIVAYCDFAGINTTEIAKKTGMDDVIVISALQVIAAGSLNGLMRRLNRTLEKSMDNEQAQIEANMELRELHATLEERINERTSELSRRAVQFRAIAEISKVVIEARGELQALLDHIANIIGEQFHFYHVGIYLLDTRKEYAHLQATNSAGSQNMLAHLHKFPVNHDSVVGNVANTGNLRIALDTGENAHTFNNPDFPDAHSEIALPLRSGDQIIGVLDIYSQDHDAFGSGEAEVLSVLADQVTIAIEVARQFEETQRSLTESERIYQQYVRQEYSKLMKSQVKRGFIYKDAEVKPLDNPLQATEILDAIKSGDMHITENKRGTKLAVPIKLRGQVIGTLSVGTNGNNKPGSEIIEIITAVVDRLALALENVRLLDEAQRRAAKERTISEGAARVSEAFDIESILQTTARELERTLGGSEVIIQLESEE
jgi:transcriptional regulator with GAF, ATPase, and Fis domain